MDEKQQPGDPEARAFTGHSDHPPAESDQPAKENQELLREGDGRSEGNDEGQAGDQGGGTGQDDQWTSLPGYG